MFQLAEKAPPSYLQEKIESHKRLLAIKKLRNDFQKLTSNQRNQKKTATLRKVELKNVAAASVQARDKKKSRLSIKQDVLIFKGTQISFS